MKDPETPSARRISENREALIKTSAALSNRLYLLNGAILGSVWAFAVSDGLTINSLSIVAAGLSVLVVIADLAQMWAGYIDLRRMQAILQAERDNGVRAIGASDRPLLRWRIILFDMKIALTLLSGAIFLTSCVLMLEARHSG